MDRLESGETFTITRRGRAVGTLVPMTGPREAVPSAELLAAFSDLAPLDYIALRSDADRFFNDDGDRLV